MLIIKFKPNCLYDQPITLNQYVTPCICMGTIKNNHNLRFKLYFFFLNYYRRCSNYTLYQLTFFLNYTFLKYVIVSHYIYDLQLNLFQTLWFLYSIIHLLQKLKTQMNTWWKIRLQLKSNLESNQIQTLRFLHLIIHLAQNLKLNGTRGAKLRIQLKFNWIFSKFWLLIYIYIYMYVG